MNPFVNYLKSLFVLLPFLLFTSCEPKPDYQPPYEPFLIKVDKIEVPISLSSNVAFDISFFGIIGNGCDSFLKFEKSQSNNEILISVWGNHYIGPNPCTDILMNLREKLNYIIGSPGVYVIKVKQPDDTYLEKQITIV
jgi:hypothetical protein